MLGELVTITSATGLELDGLLFRSQSSTTTVIHVHGSFGNFYQGRLLRTMAKLYPPAGINLFSVNMSSHDGLAEGYWHDGQFRYIGGSVATFEDCSSDIAGAVAFAQQFSKRIILQGHSLGCDRVLHFALTQASKADLILLAPCDSYQLQVNWIAPETVDQQLARLKSRGSADEYDWLPLSEYGVRAGPDWTYSLPITLPAFLSIAEGPPYRLINIAEPCAFQLSQAALVCIGGQDALQVWPSETMFEYFRHRFGAIERLHIAPADHMFSDYESDVASAVVKWISGRD